MKTILQKEDNKVKSSNFVIVYYKDNEEQIHKFNGFEVDELMEKIKDMKIEDYILYESVHVI